MYQEEYSYSSDDTLNENTLSEFNEIDMPRGWSFICLDETINYYKENLDKDTINKP